MHRYEVLHETVSPGFHRGETVDEDRLNGQAAYYERLGAIRRVEDTAPETGTEIGDGDVKTLKNGGKGGKGKGGKGKGK